MKHKKTVKQKLVEMGYQKPALEHKLNTLEKSFQEVKKIINDKS